MSEAPATASTAAVPGVSARSVSAGLFAIQVINATYNVLAEHMLSKDGTDPIVFSTYRDLLAWPILHLAAVAVRRWPEVRGGRTHRESHGSAHSNGHSTSVS